MESGKKPTIFDLATQGQAVEKLIISLGREFGIFQDMINDYVSREQRIEKRKPNQCIWCGLEIMTDPMLLLQHEKVCPEKNISRRVIR